MKSTVTILIVCAALIACAVAGWAQTPPEKLPVHYEELTAPDFVTAVGHAGNTCLIPIGVLEKHGPHLPLGTDMLDVREVAIRAAAKEYCVVFPAYYFGQIFEAKHQPGTIAYSTDLLWQILQETCDELGRNGFTNIVLVNGHGGNNSFLPFFCQAQLERKRDYAVFIFQPALDAATREQARKLRTTTTGGHADEAETSSMYAHRPDIVHPERAGDQSGEDMKRLDSLPFAYTPIWWYAKYPNHYAGDGSHASKELGELLITSEVDQLVKLVKFLKTDITTHRLQREFYERSEQPLDTPQR